MTRREMLALSSVGGFALAQGWGASSTVEDFSPGAPTPRAMRKLRILILGGTGFIGPHQVTYALSRGHQVTLFNRGRRPQAWPGEVEERTGDREKGDLASLAEGEWDVCIDNPTTLPSWVRDAGNVLGPRVKHYIFISTISVLANTSVAGSDEEAEVVRYQGNDPLAETHAALRSNPHLYGALKAESEKRAFLQFPDRTTVIRPTLIVGPGDETDRFTYWPVRLAKGGEVLAPGDGTDPVQVIDARDLAEWTIRVAEARSLGTFHAVGPDFEQTVAGLLYGIRAVTTAGAQLNFVSSEFLREQGVSPWSDLPVWVPGHGGTAGFARVSYRKAKEAGLTFRSLATTAMDTWAWWQTLPRERQQKLRAGLSPEREAEVLQRWKTRSRLS
ncbi:MAG TPA: hypothetical protein PLN52_04385 [Opitutaceae bacterium]|nr:hypothetical protein [Opitutaceae bacterium]